MLDTVHLQVSAKGRENKMVVLERREAAGTRPWLSSEISEEENYHHIDADVRVSLTKTGNNTGQH